MTTISAGEAGKAMSAVATSLLQSEIVQPEGYNVLLRLAREIERGKKAITWSIEVDPGAPVLFKRTRDEKNRWVTPRIVADIKIEQGDEALLPFKALDIALEVDNDAREPLSRWHLDLANNTNGVFQSGPYTHLQFGGHHHGTRGQDHPLKVPRWCYPPMEIALLCEVVAANFYEEEWLSFRDEPNWCQAISLYQRLCYSHYLNCMVKSLSVSSKTALNEMWASSYE